MPEKRKDWVYILDHTIDFGAKKCLLVLGITLECFRNAKCEIKHNDMEILAINIVEKATATSVTKVLRDVSKSTGVPVQVLSDDGVNIKKGVNDFIDEKKVLFSIRRTYDVTHKTALILKHHLKDDTQWKLFVDYACKTKRSLVHTPLAYLAPPKPKDKARWMNLEPYINWAEKILSLTLKNIEKENHERFKSELRWIRKFRKSIDEWRTILNLLQALKKEIKSFGFSKDTKKNFEKTIIELDFKTGRLVSIKEEILVYIDQECKDIDGVYPGCSDIIESVIGKYKTFSSRSPMKEVGKAVLTMPVFTSSIDPLEVKEAMENVSDKDLKKWLNENIGQSLFSKRKEVFSLKKIKTPINKNRQKLKKVAGF